MIAVGEDLWTAETRRGDDALAGLHDDWEDLYARSSTATPFQAYTWLESWWRSYGTPGTLRLTLVRHRGRLVAAAPFMLSRRLGAAVLTPLGGALADFTDVLVADDTVRPATRILARALLLDPGWDAVDLPESRPGPAGAALWRTWSGRTWRMPASLCFEVPAMEMEHLVRALPAKTRKTVRRRLNQLARTEMDVREVTPGRAAPAVAELLRLHELQWRGRGINEHHLSPQFAAHLTRSVTGMLARGQAALYEYRLDGRLMCSSLLLIGRDLVGGYLYGADPELRDRVDVSTMLMNDTLPLAHRLGRPTMSMLRGDEPYKLRWQPRPACNERMVLGRPRSVRAMAYGLRVRSVRAVVQAAKEHAPWLRTVRDRLRRGGSDPR
ncbi:GNAT family N-acetyltransferase [Nucisporomicrobium flavum]|uniref:GNAT family N-acetyltransferase n=1 Tax=Nucisporomicrobium flavum TaxID=2785915 RepID=UPI0018F71B82|nr:GNAT family N-acetyltransferase [Nucisporomicrobium flavum]